MNDSIYIRGRLIFKSALLVFYRAETKKIIKIIIFVRYKITLNIYIYDNDNTLSEYCWVVVGNIVL